MKTSRRASRMQRHYRRMHRAGGLNLVSLMDIFTILVFFLMVNSSDVKVMQNTADVPLPASTSNRAAPDTLIVQVTATRILVQGREVARLDQIPAETVAIKGLSEELAYLKQRRYSIPDTGLQVTVMAGRDTHYRLLRKIMQTCVDQDYRQVHLAVEQSREVGRG
ncbi:ExbD/TolR family protein [Marinobacter caseinilyticus]|uniref:ExbD/TolR family protein n=1 Tax=Marinobacter caseinilyticus TaxID=2692195 RepID=UPI00140BC64A|nr:biopolymer transporter ExbD [Marinobacter caseinilyticus]